MNYTGDKRYHLFLPTVRPYVKTHIFLILWTAFTLERPLNSYLLEPPKVQVSDT